MIIDFHTHCFPDGIAAAAIEKLNSSACDAGFQSLTDGTAVGTLALLRDGGVDIGVVCNIATNSRQQTNVNNFAIQLNNTVPGLRALGSIHPDSENAPEELQRLRENGIRGIKIHPDYVRVPLTDRRFIRLFGLCAELDMFVVTHAGYDPISPDFVHASPADISRVITEIPGLKLIAAHMGACRAYDEVERLLVGREVYIDTSLASQMPEYREQFRRIILNHPPERILFGSDLPWSSPSRELEFIRSLEFPNTLREKITGGNARTLLGL